MLRIYKALVFSSEHIVDVYVAVILGSFVFIGQLAFVVGLYDVVDA